MVERVSAVGELFLICACGRKREKSTRRDAFVCFGWGNDGIGPQTPHGS